MARKKKKALSQEIVNVATTGMPSPVRKFLGGRLTALLIVVAVPLLLATGIVTVQWESGRPSISVNRQQAQEVKREAAERIESLRSEQGGDRPQLGFEAKSSGGLGSRFSDRVDGIKDRFSGDGESRWSLPSSESEGVGNGRQATLPLRGVQSSENRR